jgi:hypothetical protein
LNYTSILIRKKKKNERFHQEFNSEFYILNQSVFMVIDDVRNIFINTPKRMKQYIKGVQNIVRAFEKQKQVIKYVIVLIFNYICNYFYEHSFKC